MFAILLFLFISIVSGVTNYTQSNIQSSLTKINCPQPDFQTGWDRTACTQPPNTRGSYVNDQYFLWRNVNLFGFGNWTAGIPIGWYNFASDWISSAVEHAGGYLGLFAVATSGATPAGFVMLGYHISDMNPLGVAFVIMLYGFCYIGIAIVGYKGLSPFVRA